MKLIFTLLCLLFIGFANCQIQCNPNANCDCYNGDSDIELQCPNNFSDYGGLLVHIKRDKNDNENIEIDCVNGSTTDLQLFGNPGESSSEVKTLTEYNMDWLPNMPVKNISHLQIRSCPLPSTNFKTVIHKFSVKDLKSLQIIGGENLSLTKEYFEEVRGVEMLKLDVSDGVLIMAEDVFTYTPKLVNIDLKGEGVVLPPKVFQPTPLLKSLDITQSKLKTLPRGLFHNLTSLRALSLWSNDLTALNDHVFEDLTNLTVLELSYNKITTISEDAFKSLINLNAAGLARNRLTTLPPSLFQHNVKLGAVKMYDNYNLTLPDYLFANLHELKEVCLSNCQLTAVPEHVFENSTQIQVLELDNNLLTSLPERVFKGLDNLERLDLHNNKITNISSVLTFARKIKTLNLENNLIGTIERNTFIHLNNLEEIKLTKNKISQIHYLAFNHESLGNLKVVDLSHNQISQPFGAFAGLNYAIFQNTVKLTHVDVSHNLITSIDDVINLENKIKLKSVDLRHNTITEVVVRNLVTLLPSGNKLEVKLDSNRITTLNFELADQVGPVEQFDANHNKKAAYTVITLTHNPIKCDCSNYDLFRYFHDALPPQVKVLFDIKADNATCVSPYDKAPYSLAEFPLSLAICPLNDIVAEYKDCPDTCLCYWRPSDRSVIVDCSHNNFTTLPDIVLPQTRLINPTQTEINFEHNSLLEGPRPNMVGYHNVTRMLLSDNQIQTLSWLPPGLQMLKLHNNSLTHLGDEVLQVLNASHLENVTLNDNPWTCDCNTVNLTNLLRQKRYVDGRHVFCANTTTPLISMGRKDLCPGGVSLILVTALPVLVVLLTLAILAALYYRYQQELKVWLFAKNLCLWWVTEEDVDKDKLYDAFISYSHKDEDFVTQNLLPVLEEKEGYKLCVHYRNWVPGEFISKQVTSSVCDSRRTIIVLSDNFLESVWGKLEFRTAHTQAMTEGRARVIVLLYGEVDVNTLDNELKMYLKTNTYVKWGDPYFWDKLKYALPHSHKRLSNSSQKHANIMNFIDDKFKLVAPVAASSSPGTTPPVLSLDPNLLKKHPLSFLPNSELDTPPAEAGTLLTVTVS